MRPNGKQDSVQSSSVLLTKWVSVLRSQLKKGIELLEDWPITRGSYYPWQVTTYEYASLAFGAKSPSVTRLVSAGGVWAAPIKAGAEWWEEREAECLASQITILEGLIETLEAQGELETGVSVPAELVPASGRVFVVHGRNEGFREMVARLLEHLDLKPIILHEQPNAGRTVIEKFSDSSEVGFAVILCTADDRGGLIDDPYEKQALRARQNVILELGFFLAKLGRKRVCVLHQEGVDLPTDYQGVLYVPLDTAGRWRFLLGKELKEAGFAVDMNKIS